MAQVGDIVHYVLAKGPNAGQCRAAIVTKVTDPVNGILTLHVLVADGDGDRLSSYAGTHFDVQEVWKDTGLNLGRWHEKGARPSMDGPKDCLE